MHVSLTAPSVCLCSPCRYAGCSGRTNVTEYEAFFTNYDEFFDVVAHIERQRKALSPSTKTTIDEVGVILPNDNSDDAEPFPAVYFNAVSAAFAYLFSNLALQGIDVLGSSQLVGYPQLRDVLGGLEPQYPSVTMVNWTTGVGTARVWLLQMLGEEFRVGDAMVETAGWQGSGVYGQGWVRRNGTGGAEERRVLLVNKKSVEQVVQVEGVVGGERLTVDEASGERPARREKVGSTQLMLAPFAVACIILPPSPTAEHPRTVQVRHD